MAAGPRSERATERSFAFARYRRARLPAVLSRAGRAKGALLQWRTKRFGNFCALPTALFAHFRRQRQRQQRRPRAEQQKRTHSSQCRSLSFSSTLILARSLARLLSSQPVGPQSFECDSAKRAQLPALVVIVASARLLRKAPRAACSWAPGRVQLSARSAAAHNVRASEGQQREKQQQQQQSIMGRGVALFFWA